MSISSNDSNFRNKLSFLEVYEKLVDIWNNEISTEDLTPIDIRELGELKERLNLLKNELVSGSLGKLEEEIYRRLIELVEEILDDLIATRFIKIIKLILERGDEKPKNLTFRDLKVFLTIKELYEKYRESFLDLSEYELTLEALDNLVEELEIVKKTSKSIAVSLVDIGDIVDIKGIPYRGIEKYDVFSMENDNLEVLEDKNAIRLIKSDIGR